MEKRGSQKPALVQVCGWFATMAGGSPDDKSPGVVEDLGERQ